ncbi:MAG: histidine triad nucleotide-binding protein [Thermoanaerobaculia bacterium]
MSETDRCLFCRIASGDIPSRKVYEDSDVLAFEDIDPKAPTHVLVIPRRHVPSLDDLGPEDNEMMGRVIYRASAIARDLGLPSEGYRVVINNGPGAGQSVFHIHAHLLGGRPFSWPPG